MTTPSLPRSRSAGFTLVELLTVIVIIAILMALLFPAILSAKEQARKAQAANDGQAIVTAVKAYYTEYGRYPDTTQPGSTTPPPTGDTFVGDTAAQITGANNATVFYTLRAIPTGPNTDNDKNPRRLNFFDGKVASNAKQPKAGFQPQTGGDASTQDCYFDPWGKQYNIVMDTDYDNQIDVSTKYSDYTSSDLPRFGVGVFSMGKDNMLGNRGDGKLKNGSDKSDDIVTWQ